MRRRGGEARLAGRTSIALVPLLPLNQCHCLLQPSLTSRVSGSAATTTALVPAACSSFRLTVLRARWARSLWVRWGRKLMPFLFYGGRSTMTTPTLATPMEGCLEVEHFQRIILKGRQPSHEALSGAWPC